MKTTVISRVMDFSLALFIVIWFLASHPSAGGTDGLGVLIVGVLLLPGAHRLVSWGNQYFNK